MAQPAQTVTIDAAVSEGIDAFTTDVLPGELAAKQDRPTYRPTWAIGDSIEADPSGYFPLACALSRQRLRQVGISGVGGETATDILGRLPGVITSALAVGANTIMFGGGTNDHNQGLAKSVTRANFESALALVRAAGLEFVVRNIPPVDAAAAGGPYATLSARRIAVQRHNAWMDLWAGENSIPVLDLYGALVDPATGGYRSGYATDLIHPNPTGVLAAGRRIASTLPPISLAPPQRVAQVSGLGENILPGNLFLGDSNADGLANGWKGGGGFTTKRLYTTDTTILGNWQRLSGTSQATIYDDTMVGVPGHAYEFSGLASVVTGLIILRMSFLTVGYVKVGDFIHATQSNSAAATKADQAVYRARGTCPATATRVQIEVSSNAGASDRHVAQFMIRDLSDLGLV